MIIVILIIGLILRLIKLDQSLWLDEAININNAAALSFKSLFFDYSLGDFHPPLYHLIIRIWILLFGNWASVVRIPSILFAIGTIYVVYIIGKKLYDKKTGLIAAILLSTAPLHIYYSQEARMYMLAAFLTSISAYFFLSLIERDKIYSWIGFITSTTLMLYSDYLPYLMLPVYILSLFILRKKIPKHTVMSFIPAFMLILVLLTPWLSVLPKQLSVGLSATAASPAWAQVVGTPTFANLLITFVKFTIGRISNDNNTTYVFLFLPAGLFVTLMFAISTFRMSPKRFFTILWFFVPVVLAFVLAYFIPIYSYFRFIFVLPAFYLIWASAINTVNIKKFTSVFLSLALVINLISLAIYYLNPKFQREDWKGAVAYVQEKSSMQTISLFESSSSFTPFDYYNKNKIPAFGALNSFNAQEEDVTQNIEKLTKEKDHVFLFQYLSGITDPTGIVFENLTEYGFRNISTRDFNGVGFVYEFKR